VGAPLRQLGIGTGIGVVLGVAVTLAVLAVSGRLAGGGDDKTNAPGRPAPTRPAVYTLRTGDVIRDPLTATRCEASGEAGYPNLFCTRMSRGRYQVVFYEDSVELFDLLDPNEQPLEPKYSFKWIAPKPISVHPK
jgi:hypothetical protein